MRAPSTRRIPSRLNPIYIYVCECVFVCICIYVYIGDQPELNH